MQKNINIVDKVKFNKETRLVEDTTVHKNNINYGFFSYVPTVLLCQLDSVLYMRTIRSKRKHGRKELVAKS